MTVCIEFQHSEVEGAALRQTQTLLEELVLAEEEEGFVKKKFF